MRILFLSTHNLATNPRLVKEIEAALKEGFEVSLACCEFDNWSKELNDQLKQKLIHRINYYPVSGNKNPFLLWAMSSVLYALSKLLLRFFSNDNFLLSLASNKRAWLLLKKIKMINEPVHLVIGHNPGSFYPTKTFAEEKKVPFGIDLEDYHPGESSDKTSAVHFKLLQNKILPFAQYISAASTLIMEYAQEDCEAVLKNQVVILNYFPLKEFIEPSNNGNDKLRLVWFSQQISFHRGLEQILPLVKKNKLVELHLFGNCNPEFKNQYLDGIENVFIHSALSQQMLHRQLSTFDVGLAIEPGKDLNNELALSNKMLAYFQAGLYILASDTEAQRLFIEAQPESGHITSLDADVFATALDKLVFDKNSVRDKAADRFTKVKEYCWEEESKKLIKVWNKIIH